MKGWNFFFKHDISFNRSLVDHQNFLILCSIVAAVLVSVAVALAAVVAAALVVAAV